MQPRALYFSADGIIRVLRENNDDAYFVLDLRQRAMLNRYIRLAKTGSIPPDPGALDVLAAAVRTETVSIEIGGRPVEPALSQAFWSALDNPEASVGFPAPPRPPADEDGYWITFTTSEGRAIQYHFNPATSALIDSLGTETYTIENVLPATTAEPLQIEQQSPHGSKLWWPVMLGGGAALLAAAVWLRRRYP